MGTVETMMNTAERYRANTAEFTKRVEAVPDDRWENQSPCAEWSARDVVSHMIDTSGMFLGFIDVKLPHAPSVKEDPLGAWTSARDAVQARLDDRATAQQEFDGMLGRSTFEAAVAKFLVPDALLHTWDLARATGLDENLDEDEAVAALETYKTLGAAVRSKGVFGPEIEAPPGADAQERLLTFAGRQP
jgi:uncharacterized protein (TIGR03086 family)